MASVLRETSAVGLSLKLGQMPDLSKTMAAHVWSMR